MRRGEREERRGGGRVRRRRCEEERGEEMRMMVVATGEEREAGRWRQMRHESLLRPLQPPPVLSVPHARPFLHWPALHLFSIPSSPVPK